MGSWRRKPPDLPQLGCHNSRDAADRSLLLLLTFPGARHRAAHVEAFDGVGKIAHEMEAAKLPVSENIEPELFLAGEDAQNVPVFDGPQPLRIVRHRLAGLEQLLRPQKTSNMVSAV